MPNYFPKEPHGVCHHIYFYEMKIKLQEYNLSSPKGQPSITGKNGENKTASPLHQNGSFFPPTPLHLFQPPTKLD